VGRASPAEGAERLRLALAGSFNDKRARERGPDAGGPRPKRDPTCEGEPNGTEAQTARRHPDEANPSIGAERRVSLPWEPLSNISSPSRT
jgi:hypothetical protein